MLRIAERRVVVTPLDCAGLQETAALFLGARPSVVPDDEEARLVTAGDLLLARRPDHDIDGYLRRVLSLASTRRGSGADAPRLEELFGMDEAVRWAPAV